MLKLLTIIFLPLVSALILFILPKKNIKAIKSLVLITMLIEIALVFQSAILQEQLTANSIFRIDKIPFHLKLDGLGLYFSMISVVLWLLTFVYSFSYMRDHPREKIFYAYMMMVLTAVLGISASANLMVLYLFYEILTLVTFPLIIFSETDEALKLGQKYLIYSFVGSSLVLVGMSIFYTSVGNLEFISNASVLNQDPVMMILSYAFLFIGFGVKSAIVPFHSWLPSAMVAPTPVSALLHAVAVVKSGVFGIMRVTYYLFGASFLQGHTEFQTILLNVISISILVGAFLAFHQSNLKKRLAYSTISQLGYILLGVVLSNSVSFTGALIHLCNHAIIKMMLFFCVGSLKKDAGIDRFEDIDGVGKKLSFTMNLFLIGTISLMGLPPMNGFVSKWYISMGAITQEKTFYVFILLFSAFMTTIYLLPVGINSFFKPEQTEKQVKKTDIEMKLPMATLLGFCFYFGIFPDTLIHFIDTYIIQILGL